MRRLCALRLALLCLPIGGAAASPSLADLARGFHEPPPATRPGVYWYFLDGNFDRAEMTRDLEAMAQAGLGQVVFLEVDLGVPAGPFKFMSEDWQDLFVHAVRETERLGLELTLGSGPGWAGSGGPWVEPEHSMQHLVASRTEVTGPAELSQVLPVPATRRPYFDIPDELQQRRDAWYRDVAVLATPTAGSPAVVEDADEKALYYRTPYTSVPGTRPYLPAPPAETAHPAGSIVRKAAVIDLTGQLGPDGSLRWQVPEGRWTLWRFGARNNGANTRPAPQPGYGFESDKFSGAALDRHLSRYVDRLLERVGPRRPGTGWTMLHIDSWEMGAQNWTDDFREEFSRRRGYDPLPFLPAYLGQVVDSVAVTERFLWDLRLTAQELVVERHATHLREYAHRHGLGLSIEPYDMNPAADLELGAVADIPMGEFWANTFNSAFSCIEAASIAHTLGRPVVGAEAFTSEDPLLLHPAALKNQLDWAFATGINRILFHTYQHQPLGDAARPGMSFGPYGVNWHRHQTWWPMVDGVHRYIARCSYLLRQGTTVADILYLTPEGAPHVFRAPASALAGDDPVLPDRRGYNFDGCAPGALLARAEVEHDRIAFPGGSSYRVLVLPNGETMTPPLLRKIVELVRAGATVIGGPPRRSPSLTGYPQVDDEVRALAAELWGTETAPADGVQEREVGAGRVVLVPSRSGAASSGASGELYPPFESIAQLLRRLGVEEDFAANGPVRYTHRRTEAADFYFVANRSGETITVTASFRATGRPECWDALSGERRALPRFRATGSGTEVPLTLAPQQSLFVVFPREASPAAAPPAVNRDGNFPALRQLGVIDGPWVLSFPPERGAPPQLTLDTLVDWSTHDDPGVRYYSGMGTYRQTFDLPRRAGGAGVPAALWLDLGDVRDIARVRLNGVDLGVVWTAPWRVEISRVVRPAGNLLEIEVANRWANRLTGDLQPADAAARTLSWESGLLAGQSFKAGRYTFLMPTAAHYRPDAPLLPSGLLGPVRVLEQAPATAP